MSDNTATSISDQLDAINDYEREPVPASKVKGFKDFLALVASEHIAGTEFVIGPLFVLHGATASDVILGLLVGNILATLSWTLICAPLAVKTRLTLFYQLERISGYKLVSIFNGISGIQACVFAAFMAVVSAGAISLVLGLETPSFSQMLPSGITWVVLVTVLVALITVIAIQGIDLVSKFATISTPWMPWVFLASGIATLPQLGVHSFSDFWTVANTTIWTGTPVEGMSKYNFWHIMFFAWLCNTAMHIGLADTFIYRYAKKSYYGIASFGGMFIGHFMAWIASGILCAAALQAGISDPTPGQVAGIGAGIAGIICVVIAGWTTANPTLYRAGLAIQGIFPSTKRWKITAWLGVAAALMASFPGIVSKLDNLLAWFALIAAPVGAIVVLEVYVFKKLNLETDYSHHRNGKINWAVAATWIISVTLCYLIYLGLELDFFFFMAIPGWFIAAIVYLFLCKLRQMKQRKNIIKDSL
ncbi:purine-cytosine permease family protein [Pedobacter glucosidilyticus]|uniref:purine-cytosine permease family protein n=1 Tax=Pedobacter glucosidilyticus TaxID=1122941 RepID=UPI0026EF553B|nr:hypothetical protein [Pedobacter glucosidilyticus]